MRAAQRGRKSQQLRQKTFEEYEWRQLGLGGEISKLKVFKLDKTGQTQSSYRKESIKGRSSKMYNKSFS